MNKHTSRPPHQGVTQLGTLSCHHERLGSMAFFSKSVITYLSLFYMHYMLAVASFTSNYLTPSIPPLWKLAGKLVLEGGVGLMAPGRLRYVIYCLSRFVHLD